MDYTKRVIELRKMGHSDEYINGYLDGSFETMKDNYFQISELTEKVKMYNELIEKKIFGGLK